jgi:hypothetical protein
MLIHADEQPLHGPFVEYVAHDGLEFTAGPGYIVF